MSSSPWHGLLCDPRVQRSSGPVHAPPSECGGRGECSRWDKKGTWSPILDHVVQNLSLYVTAKLAVTETD
eukprot:scaffold13006_cov32-Phaeocystis_antarctica.AAC.2